MSRREPVTTAALKSERFFALLQWPKNHVGLQAPLSSANSAGGGETRAGGGAKIALRAGNRVSRVCARTQWVVRGWAS